MCRRCTLLGWRRHILFSFGEVGLKGALEMHYLTTLDSR